MDKTYSVLKEVWDENYSQWLSVKKENEPYVEMLKKVMLLLLCFSLIQMIFILKGIWS
ncbi:MAG TPA: hypothetical protein VK085_09170 [Pseudogracilibacillus sp.]|nr:hypothetical protein [Pseudogracilibacillus sp.]